MGLRNSKSQKSSYDIAPVVSDKDFEYKQKSKLANPNNVVTQNTVIPADDKPIAPANVVVVAAEAENEDEIDCTCVPSWVNEEYFIDILRKNVDGFERITKFKAYPALGKGENYATLMLRVSIDVELKDASSKNISYMLKVAHDTEQMKQMLGLINFFDIENGMYFDVIPALESIYKEAGLDVCFAPKSYKFEKDPGFHTVLLEDLRPHGYKNANRLECLNMEHTKAVLKKMAQFHAASATYIATKGRFSETIMSEEYNEDIMAIMKGMIYSFKSALCDNLPSYKDGEKYRELIEANYDDMMNHFVEMNIFDENAFNVLNHGDCWSNNILFKYADNGEILDTMFVDFQGCLCRPPAQDLYYFLMSSVQIEIKLKHFDYFIRFYYDNLVENLKLFNYPKTIPTLRDLHTTLFNFGPWAISTSMMTLAIVLLDSTDTANFDNFASESDEGKKFKNMLFTNKRYRLYMEQILPWLHNRGLLDGYKRQKEISPSTVPATNPIPEWVTEEYFVDVLKANVNNFKCIKKFDVGLATNAGDNYASTMLKVDIDVELQDGTTQSVTYMLKVAPAGEQANIMLTSMATFKKEYCMYHEYIPKFEKLYKDVGADIVFGPQSLEFVKDPGCETILLENLRPLGFKNADRLAGLDMEHTKCTLIKLAELHAASAHYYATNGAYPELLLMHMFSDNQRAISEKLGEAFFAPFYESVKQYNGSDEYIHKIEQYSKNAFDVMNRTSKVDSNKFNVINHGDCWTNNIMFQYDAEGKIKNTYFVDFQMSAYGSPARDLYYFLVSSPQLELKTEQFDYFIRFYHENLIKNLKMLQYTKHVPSLKELHIELLNSGAWGLSTVSGVMCAILLDPSENSNMENLLGESEEGVEFKKQMYSHQRYRSHAELLLTWLNRRGLLDIGNENAVEPTTPSVKIPEWVNAENFVDILQENVEGFSKIVKLVASPGTKGGDNYASLMLKVEIDAELKDGSIKYLTYMLKISPLSDTTDAMLSMWNFFPKELSMYNNYVTEFERMYKTAGVDVVFAPKTYKFKNNPSVEYILMENLQQYGFKNEDRLQGLDMTHTKCVLRKLAQFHAASVKHVELKGAYPEMLHSSLYTEKTREMFDVTAKKSHPIYLESVLQYEGHEEYRDQLVKLLPKVNGLNVAAYKVNCDDFNVLNHGDGWLNNFMFQHDDKGNVTETLFVDFQVSKYGTPATDLWYFLMSSTHLDIKLEQFDYFIKYYHDNLIESLQLFKYTGKVPTLKELHGDLLKYGIMGFSAFFGTLGICLLDPSENANIENFMADTPESREFLKQMSCNSRYKAHAEKILPWLYRRGILEV